MHEPVEHDRRNRPCKRGRDRAEFDMPCAAPGGEDGRADAVAILGQHQHDIQPDTARKAQDRLGDHDAGNRLQRNCHQAGFLGRRVRIGRIVPQHGRPVRPVQHQKPSESVARHIASGRDCADMFDQISHSCSPRLAWPHLYPFHDRTVTVMRQLSNQDISIRCPVAPFRF